MTESKPETDDINLEGINFNLDDEEISEEKPEEINKPEEKPQEPDPQEPDEIDKYIDEKLSNEPKKDEFENEWQQTITELKKKNEESDNKITNLETQYKLSSEQQQSIYSNNIKLNSIDNEILKLDSEANSIIHQKNELKQKLEAGVITVDEFEANLSKISIKTNEIITKHKNLIQERQLIPTPEEFARREEIKNKNNKQYEEFSKEITDDLLKKHIDKLKAEQYDAFGYPIEHPTFKNNVDWITNIVKESDNRGYKRGYQAAVERIAEKQAKGNLQIRAAGTGRGTTPHINKPISGDDLLKMNDSDLSKVADNWFSD